MQLSSDDSQNFLTKMWDGLVWFPSYKSEFNSLKFVLMAFSPLVNNFISK
jgi:hypothetical protein